LVVISACCMTQIAVYAARKRSHSSKYSLNR
jgi:hypothetical protein